nr:MAG: hypothetical protein DIU66_06985 [Bacillota bacterium]
MRKKHPFVKIVASEKYDYRRPPHLIGWQISQIDPRWELKPSGGGTPDLVYNSNIGIRIKCSSDNTIKGNRVSANEGYYILVKYTIEDFTITIKEILMGDLPVPIGASERETEERLCRIYP